LLKDAKSAAASQLRAPAFKRWRSSLKPLSSCCLTRARRRPGLDAAIGRDGYLRRIFEEHRDREIAAVARWLNGTDNTLH
jgi:hypothetical protein